jgi:TorA maturation chaperone TorD
MGPSAAEVAHLLEDAGRRVAEGSRLLPDHLSVELSLAADLLERHDWDAFHAILDRHLARWLPAFVARLEIASAHPYYVELARLADRLVGIDLAGGLP